MYKKYQFYIPIIVIQIYLWIVLALFKFGPWDWPVEPKNPIYLYIITSYILIFIGYCLGIKSIKKCNVTNLFSSKNLEKFIFIGFILAIPTCFARSGSLFPTIILGITETGYAYNLSQESRLAIFEKVRFLLAYPLFALTPLYIVNFQFLNRKFKIFGSFVILFYLSIYVSIGTNKGLFDLFVISIFIILFKLIKSQKVLRLKPILKKGLIYIISAVLIFNFFTKGQMEREGMVGVRGVHVWGSTEIQAEINGPDFISDYYYLGYLSLSKYLAHGYYALSQSFNIDFGNTFPFGNSQFLARNFNKLLDTDKFIDDSFPARFEVERGWSYLGLWHTAYSWYLSEVGHFGTLILFSIISFLLGRSWKQSLVYYESLPLIKFVFCVMIFIYLPLNNQMFQDGENTILFFMMYLVFPVIKKLRSRKIQ